MEIEASSVYRVDHSNSPNSSLPSSLNSIQAVLVKDKSDQQLTVVFPSNKSLDKFFGGENLTGSLQPSMDDKLVMSFDLGKTILTHKISFEEFAVQRGNTNFWVLGNHENQENCEDNEADQMGVKWEKRKRTKFYTRRKCGNKKSNNNDEDEEGANNKKEEEDENAEKPVTRVVPKRKCQFKEVRYSDKKKRKMSNNKNKNKGGSSQKKLIHSQHRWTAERYKLAEKNLAKIMREKGVGPNNPILRPELRAEARKLIGDTGLLDHLLKHMTGKLTCEGKERFCRRHNPEGAMEYWLESADVAQKQVGDVDPACALQLTELREEVSNMKREIEKLASKRGQEKRPENGLEIQETLKPLKEMYEETLKKKANVEKQLLDIFKSFSKMEMEIVSLKKSTAASTESMSPVAEKQSTGVVVEEVKSMGATKAEEKEEKRGFKICKPRSSFAWPSSCCSSQDLVGCPTPPSVSSTNRTSAFIFPPSHQRAATVVKPLAARAGVCLFVSTASINGSTTIHSIARRPTPCSSISVDNFVPDLNYLPIS